MKNLNIIQSRPTLNEPAKYGRVFPELKEYERVPLILKRDSFRLYDFMELFQSGRYSIAFSDSRCRSSNVIESTLLGMTNPDVILYMKLSGKSAMLHGGNYLWSLMNFMNGKFKLEGLSLLPQYNGMDASTLPSEKIAYLQKYHIHYFRFETKITTRIALRVIKDKQSDKCINLHELRKILFEGDATSYMSRLAVHLFEKATEETEKEALAYLALNVFEPPRIPFGDIDELFDAMMHDFNQSWNERYFLETLKSLDASSLFQDSNFPTFSESSVEYAQNAKDAAKQNRFLSMLIEKKYILC